MGKILFCFRYRACLCAPFVFFLFAPHAWCDPAVETSQLPAEVWRPDESSATKNVDFLKIQNSQYVNSGVPAFRPGAATQNSSIMVGIDNQAEWHNGFFARAKASDEYSSTENWNYVDVYDLEAGVRLGQGTRLSVGRRLDNWSDWDSRWQQGEFQSRYMENGLRPRAAGLTGAFVETHSEHWNYTLGVMPIFIPDFGPHYSVQDNAIVSRNPWFKPPSTEFILGTGTGDIHYALADADANHVAFHPGMATKVEYRDGGYSSRLSYAYKPISNVLLGFPSNGFVSGPNNSYMQLTITPRVVYNRVINWDNQYAWGAWQVNGSVAVDDPVQNRGPADWTEQQVSSATIVSGAISRRLEEDGPHAARIELGFLKVNGGDSPDSGFFAGSSTRFTPRFQFYEAYMLTLSKEFRFHIPVNNELRLIYDRLQQGGAITFTSEARLTSNWRVDLEVDVLGLLTSTGEVSDGFLSSYRANNRVGVGASYVF